MLYIWGHIRGTGEWIAAFAIIAACFVVVSLVWAIERKWPAVTLLLLAIGWVMYNFPASREVIAYAGLVMALGVMLYGGAMIQFARQNAEQETPS